MERQAVRLALLNGRLIDGTGREPQDGWGLVVEGTTIKSVGPTAMLDVPSGATVVDVGGRTLMPGLIDAHTHLTYHRGEHALILQQLNETLEMNTLRAAENARLILETGCTAIGDGAGRGNIAVAIRDAVRQGIIPGPKVVAAGQMLSGSGGIGDHTDARGHHEHETLLGTVVDGPQEVRAAVRRQIRRGVDWIKLTASGTPGNLWIGGRTPDLGDGEIRAAVEEAAKFGKPVHAHAHGAEAVKAAVRAGVISVHSAEFADDEALGLMKERGCVFVPTIGWLHFRVSEDYAREYTRAYRLGDAEICRFVDECRQAYEACREAIVRAFAIGTPTAIGSDGAHVFPPFDIVREMEYFQELGIAPLEATAAYLEEAIADWGCPSFKFDLAYRQIRGAPPGDDWNELDDGLMLEALERMARWDGTLACVHAENPDVNNRAIARVRARGADGLAAWEEANPGIAEAEAVLRAGLYAERTGVPVYFVHLSGQDALAALRRVRAHWPRAYGETCPHYLFHNVETSPPAVKFSPPVRHRADNEALWEALAAGFIECVGSDNAPTLWAAKQGTVWDIVRGGPGAGVLLPFVLSEGVGKGRLSLERAVEVTSTSAARIFGLYPRKGAIQVGADADLVLVDLGLEKTVTRELYGTWSDYNLYTGVKLRGWPVVTMLRGRVVVRDGAVQVVPGYGRFLPRQAHRREVARPMVSE